MSMHCVYAVPSALPQLELDGRDPMQMLGIELMPSEEQPVLIAILQTSEFKEKCFYLYVHDGFDNAHEMLSGPKSCWISWS